jgi:hypothetical protein
VLILCGAVLSIEPALAGQNPRGDVHRFASSGWGKTIKIGLHLPITGPAPTGGAVQKQKDLFWRYGGLNGRPVSIRGRHVTVEVRDDQYDPSHARRVCKRMVQDGVFLLLGLIGPDQVVACAKYAATVHVPYLSAGVSQRILRKFRNYYAVSMTYRQQSALLARYVKKTFTHDCSQVLMVVEDTPNYDGAITAFEKACPGAEVRRPAKGDSGQAYGAPLCLGTVPRYKAVYALHTPTFFLDMAASSNTCHPQFVGVGITMGVDAVADQYCKRQGLTGHLLFFSPASALKNAKGYDPRYLAAANKAGVAPDDLGWLVWQTSKALRALLAHAGMYLTRSRFIKATATADYRAPGFTDLHYYSTNHFGANQVNLLGNTCKGSSGRYVTKKADVSGF